MKRRIKPPLSTEVKSVFYSYPHKMRSKLFHLRRLIFETAADIEGIGYVEETLRWGEPSYLTSSKSGSTIRIAWKEKKENQYSMFFKCTANLVPAFKKKYPDTFTYGENRSIDFDFHGKVPGKELKKCIAMALTYHRNKNLRARDRWSMVDKLME